MFKYDYGAHRDEAHRFLQELLPEARRRADQMPPDTLGLADAGLFACLGEANLAGLHVYMVGDGWMADFVLQDVPSFAPPIIGGQSDRPMPSRGAAIEWALHVATMIVTYERLRQATPDPEPMLRFVLHDMSLTLPIARLESICAGNGTDPRPEEAIRERLDRVIEGLLPGAVTAETFGALPHVDQVRIAALCMCLVTKGVYRHPG